MVNPPSRTALRGQTSNSPCRSVRSRAVQVPPSWAALLRGGGARRSLLVSSEESGSGRGGSILRRSNTLYIPYPSSQQCRKRRGPDLEQPSLTSLRPLLLGMTVAVQEISVTIRLPFVANGNRKQDSGTTVLRQRARGRGRGRTRNTERQGYRTTKSLKRAWARPGQAAGLDGDCSLSVA